MQPKLVSILEIKLDPAFRRQQINVDSEAVFKIPLESTQVDTNDTDVDHNLKVIRSQRPVQLCYMSVRGLTDEEGVSPSAGRN